MTIENILTIVWSYGCFRVLLAFLVIAIAFEVWALFRPVYFIGYYDEDEKEKESK
jgi:hypothetical protein